MNRGSQAFASWKEADAAARAAEARLREAWERFDSKTGPAPSQELLEQVSHLRTVANERLSMILLQMGSQNC